MLGQMIPFGKETKGKDPQEQRGVTNMRPMVWRCSLAVKDWGAGTQKRETVKGTRGSAWKKPGKKHQARRNRHKSPAHCYAGLSRAVKNIKFPMTPTAVSMSCESILCSGLHQFMLLLLVVPMLLLHLAMDLRLRCC